MSKSTPFRPSDHIYTCKEENLIAEDGKMCSSRLIDCLSINFLISTCILKFRPKLVSVPGLAS